jgi:hypothetical protein
MVDGDAPLYSAAPEDKKLWEDICLAYKEWIAGKQPDEKLWKDYHLKICKEANQKADQGFDVVVSFVCYKRYVRDLIRRQISDVKFMQLEAPIDILMERSTVRFHKAVAQMGMTAQQAWESPEPEMVASRKKYGEYSEENLAKYTRDTYYNGQEPFQPDEKNVFILDQSDFTGNKSIIQLHRMLNITGPIKVDVAAIEGKQMARYAKM